MTTEQSSKKPHILIVDDDRKLCRLLTDYLAPMGYETTAAHTGPEGLETLQRGVFDAVILDVMLPGMDGFEVLGALRKQTDVPVLMLTARGDETDRVVGLEMGADDYLPKPFSTRELLARLRAVIRRFDRAARQPESETEDRVVVGDLTMDSGARTAFLAGQALPLTSIEFDLLLRLCRAAGRVVSRDQLLDAIAGREYEVFDRSVDVHVSSLRKKLGDDPRNPKYIRTVRGAGYMLMTPAENEK